MIADDDVDEGNGTDDAGDCASHTADVMKINSLSQKPGLRGKAKNLEIRQIAMIILYQRMIKFCT